MFARKRDRYGEAIAADAEEMASVVVDAVIHRTAAVLLEAALAHDGLPPEAVGHALVGAALQGHVGASRVEIGVVIPRILIRHQLSDTFYARMTGIDGGRGCCPYLGIQVIEKRAGKPSWLKPHNGGAKCKRQEPGISQTVGNRPNLSIQIDCFLNFLHVGRPST